MAELFERLREKVTGNQIVFGYQNFHVLPIVGLLNPKVKNHNFRKQITMATEQEPYS